MPTLPELLGQTPPVPTPITPAPGAKGTLDSVNTTPPPKRGKGMPPAGGGDTPGNSSTVRG